jgi:hypothetical protein
MARKLSTRETVGIGLLAVAAAAYLFWYRDDNRLFGRAPDEVRLPAPEGEAPLVHMDDLVAQAEPFDPDGRNLFQYYIPPPPPRRVVAPPAQQHSRTRPKPPPARTQQIPAQQASRGARPPVVSFKYLGYLGPKDDKIAVFEKGDELKLARVGEVVEEEFRLEEFKYEGVIMGYTDRRFKDQTTELAQSR